MESMHRALLDGESGEIVRRIYVKEKNVGCLSPCSFCSIFFCQNFLVWYGYKEVITCEFEVSFDIV